MLQIPDREDFATRLAYFMTAQQHLANAGITPTGEDLQVSTNKFLDQFTIPAQKQPESNQMKVLVGYVITEFSSGHSQKVAHRFRDQLFATFDAAKIELERTTLPEDLNSYKINAIYL